MAERVAEIEVKEIIDTTLTDEDISPFISAANALVNATLLGESYSGALLKVIELWLSAHFVAIRDPQIAKEKLGEAEATYEGKTGTGLMHTRYGQQAILLDVNGVLAAIATSKGPAEVKAIS